MAIAGAQESWSPLLPFAPASDLRLAPRNRSGGTPSVFNKRPSPSGPIVTPVEIYPQVPSQTGETQCARVRDK